MSYEPHLKRGGELYHYRTVGSRNGYSKDPNYRPKGKKAVGKLVNGKYVYEMQPKKTSLADRFNAARKSAGNWLSDRGRDVSKAASSARKSAGRLASKVGSSAKKAAKYVTGGSKAREKVNETKFRLDVAKTYGGSTKTALSSSHNQRKAANSRKAANNYEKSYANRSILDFRGQNSDAKGALKEKSNAKKYQKAADENKALNNQIKREQVADARANYNKATKEYNNTLEGKVANAANKAKKSASKAINNAGKSLDSARKNASDWLNDRGEDISKTANNVKKSASKAINNAGKKAKKAGESVSKFASDSFDSAKKSASEGAKRAGEFISGLTKKKEKSKSNIKPIETKPIETKPIETKPIETKPIETKPIETKTKKKKVDAKAFAKFVVESNKNADKSSVSINDKPDGVSDEYWRDYKFNGGTRESYDKEMKARSSSKNSSKASEYRSNAALARDTGEMHVDNDKKYRAKYNKKTTAQDIIDRNKKRAQFINKSKSYEKAADFIDGMGNKYEYKRVKTSSKAIPYSGYYAPKSENASKSSSKSSNSAKSEPTQSSNNESIIKDEDYNKRHPKQRHHLNMDYKYR